MTELEMKNLREQKGVTLEELASFLQTTEIYLDNIEKGKARRVDPEFISSIIKMLDIIPEIKKKFKGRTLQAWRKERNLTVKDLVSKSGVSAATIRNFEKGRAIPSDKKAQQLLNALKAIPVLHVRMSGKELYERRKELGISRKCLADTTGISESYLKRIEEEKVDTPLIMKSLIENLEVLSVNEHFKNGKQFVIIVERLDKLRQEFGLTWNDVVSQSGISVSTLFEFLNGNVDLNEDHLDRLEWVFNISKDEFISRGILFYK